MMLLPAVRVFEALQTEPSTPRRSKRQRLARHTSDEKENMQPPNLPAHEDGVLKKNSASVAILGQTDRLFNEASIITPRPLLQPLQVQAQDSRGVSQTCSPSHQAQIYPLVGREQECAELDVFLKQGLTNGMGNGQSLYISGGPGTGKTCSVRAGINNFKRCAPDTLVLEVNCMELTQRSAPGVLQRLLDKMGCPRVTGRSLQSLAATVTSHLARQASRVVIVVDEVDQLVSRAAGKAASSALSLETLFSLPRLPGAPAIAIVAIANAVDLLERTAVLSAGLNCRTLLFEVYSKEQLKNIVTSSVKAVEGGEAALKALGPIKVELRVRQVAKECGDCRQVISLIEEALFEAKCVRDAALEPSTSAADASSEAAPVARQPRPMNQSSRNDPLKAIPQLPLEQQILLSALATSKQEATRVSEVCSRYKELCRALRQPDNLGSKGQVNSALSALEQRGLLEMRSPKGSCRGRGKMPVLAEVTVELSVSCSELRKSVVRALPLLERYMD